MEDPTPSSLHGEPLGVEPNPRALYIENAVMNQIDRIGYLRSIGEDWDEPVFHLRDLVVGLEDDEFWTGIPSTIDKEKLSKEDLETYQAKGWNTIKIQRRTIKRGNKETKILDPTPPELALMLRIIMALLARRGITWRRKNQDNIPTVIEDDDSA